MSGSKRTAVALGTSAVLAVGGLLIVGQPAGAQTTTKPMTFGCGWETEAGMSDDFDTQATLDAPELVEVGTNADLTLSFKDGLIAEMPVVEGGATLEGAELALTVVGGPPAAAVLSVAAGDLTADAKGVTASKPLKGAFKPVSAGEHSFTTVKLVVKVANHDDWVCQSEAREFPVLKVKQSTQQSISVPTLPSRSGSATPSATSPSTSLTQSVSVSANPTSSSSSDPLPNTGSDGGGVIAFGMLAGTAALGGLAVILSSPARRRRNQAQT